MSQKSFADYDKTIDYKDYQAGYAGAVERARKLDELADASGKPGGNPTTGVYELTESIVPRSPEVPREKPAR